VLLCVCLAFIMAVFFFTSFSSSSSPFTFHKCVCV
jgi:hypothetical protein